MFSAQHGKARLMSGRNQCMAFPPDPCMNMQQGAGVARQPFCKLLFSHDFRPQTQSQGFCHKELSQRAAGKY